MHSPGEPGMPSAGSAPARLLIERMCRVLTLAALIAAIWWMWKPGLSAAPDGRTRVFSVDDSQADLAGDIARFLRDPARSSDTLLASLNALPDASARALLGAVAAAGLPFQWLDSSGARGLALSVTRDASPAALAELRASWPMGTLPLIIADRGGVIDSLDPGTDLRAATPSTYENHGLQVSAWRLAAASPPMEARLGHSVAIRQGHAARPPRRVMLVGTPSWESKFTTAALEEAGWGVDSRLQLSPTAFSESGNPGRLDTARYDVVVVVDSTHVDAAAIRRFVRLGGGLVLTGDALRIPELADLRPARAIRLQAAIAGALVGPAPRDGLESWLLSAEPGAETLVASARVNGSPLVLARRDGAGRVVAMAYRQLWRWRMEGSDEGMSEHRNWWSAVLAAAAFSNADQSGTVMADPLPGDAAPWADMAAMAGMPLDSVHTRVIPMSRGSGTRALSYRLPLPAILFAVVAISLLVEWTSRRLRGAR